MSDQSTSLAERVALLFENGAADLSNMQRAERWEQAARWLRDELRNEVNKSERMELAALRAVDRMKARGIVAGNHSDSTRTIMEDVSESSKAEIANVRKGETNWRVD